MDQASWVITIDPVHTSGRMTLEFDFQHLSGSTVHKNASALVGGPPAPTEGPRSRSRYSTSVFEKIPDEDPAPPTNSCEDARSDWDDHQEGLLPTKGVHIHTDNTNIQRCGKKRDRPIQGIAEAKAKRQKTSDFAPNSPHTDLRNVEAETGDELSLVPATQMELIDED
jgi:hypothetical protein